MTSNLDDYRRTLRTGSLAVHPTQIAYGPAAVLRQDLLAGADDAEDQADDVALAAAFDAARAYLASPAAEVLAAAWSTARAANAAAEQLLAEHRVTIAAIGRQLAEAGAAHVQAGADVTGWCGAGVRPDGATGFNVAGVVAVTVWEDP